MPELSRFYGIIIKMYFQQSEHVPPHFHVIYDNDTAEIDIQKLEIIEGYLPPKALSMVMEWAALHQQELLNMWESQEFSKIEPLR